MGGIALHNLIIAGQQMTKKYVIENTKSNIKNKTR